MDWANKKQEQMERAKAIREERKQQQGIRESERQANMPMPRGGSY
jgi:hypothetical protein